MTAFVCKQIKKQTKQNKSSKPKSNETQKKLDSSTQRLGRVVRDRSGGGGPRNLDSPFSAGDGEDLERDRVWGLQEQGRGTCRI